MPLSSDLFPRVARREVLLAGAGLAATGAPAYGAVEPAVAARSTDPRLFDELSAMADAIADPWLRVAALRELVWQAKAGADPSALDNPVARFERGRAEVELSDAAGMGPVRSVLEALALDSARSSIADPHVRRQFPPHEQDVTPNLYVEPFGPPVAVVVRLESGLDPRKAPSGGHWIEASLLRDGLPVACARVRSLAVLGSTQPAGQRPYRVRIRNLSAAPLWVNICPFQSKPIGAPGACPP